MKTAMMIIVVALLSGCVRYVNVPVSSCTEPKPFDLPYLMVDNLTTTATTQDKLQAIKVDHGAMRKSLEECKTLLDGYRKPPPQKVEPKS